MGHRTRDRLSMLSVYQGTFQQQHGDLVPGVTHTLPQSLRMETTAADTVCSEAGVHHIPQQAPKGKKEPPFWAMRHARPAETSRAGVLSLDPWGRARTPCIPPSGQSQLSPLTLHKACKNQPRVSPVQTFPADNLRGTCPKPKLGHVLCQMILFTDECIYLKILI